MLKLDYMESMSLSSRNLLRNVCSDGEFWPNISSTNSRHSRHNWSTCWTSSTGEKQGAADKTSQCQIGHLPKAPRQQLGHLWVMPPSTPPVNDTRFFGFMASEFEMLCPLAVMLVLEKQQEQKNQYKECNPSYYTHNNWTNQWRALGIWCVGQWCPNDWGWTGRKAIWWITG